MKYTPTLKWLVLVSFSFIMMIIFLFPFIIKMNSFMFEWPLVTILSTQICLTFMLDTHTSLFMIMIMFISMNVYMFSMYYMNDHTMPRFYMTLSAFIMSMILFTMMPNMMSLMLGWDGLGVSSFLLVAYYQTPNAAGSALITMFTNRIGDAILLLNIAMMSINGHWNILNNWHPSMWFYLLLILATMTKSAQIPFHLWLPEAMAAPTPVSALVHSSTLVTAGVYLLMRVHHSIFSLPTLVLMIKIVGLSTMFTAGIAGCIIKDSKKVIAYSTMSQIALMLISMSWGALDLAFFHMMTHAVFKALMFISLGGIMLMKKHSQSVASARLKKSGLLLSTAWKFAIAALNAVPFTAGFYSKDAIFEVVIVNPYINPFLWFLYLLPTLLTMTYSVRLIRGGSTAKKRKQTPSMNHHQMNVFMYTTLSIMTIMSMMTGAIILWLMPPMTPVFMYMKQNVAILIMPLMGWTLALNTCRKYVKMKKSFLKRPEIPVYKEEIHNNSGVILKYATWAVMSYCIVKEPRFDGKYGDFVWGNIFDKNKTINLLALNYIKLVEKTSLTLPVNSMMMLITHMTSLPSSSGKMWNASIFIIVISIPIIMFLM